MTARRSPDVLSDVRELVPPVRPGHQPGRYDAAMMPRIVWGPQPGEAASAEERIGAHRLSHRRRVIGAAAALVIGVGLIAELVALATRPVVERSEPLPTATLTQTAKTLESAAAPPAVASANAAAAPWSVATTTAVETPAVAPTIAEVPVTALPVAPAPVRAETAPATVPHRIEQVPEAARRATRPWRTVQVHVEPAPVPYWRAESGRAP